MREIMSNYYYDGPARPSRNKIKEDREQNQTIINHEIESLIEIPWKQKLNQD